MPLCQKDAGIGQNTLSYSKAEDSPLNKNEQRWLWLQVLGQNHIFQTQIYFPAK
jgi:hypothetical protein